MPSYAIVTPKLSPPISPWSSDIQMWVSLLYLCVERCLMSEKVLITSHSEPALPSVFPAQRRALVWGPPWSSFSYTHLQSISPIFQPWLQRIHKSESVWLLPSCLVWQDSLASFTGLPMIIFCLTCLYSTHTFLWYLLQWLKCPFEMYTSSYSLVQGLQCLLNTFRIKSKFTAVVYKTWNSWALHGPH